MDRQKIEEQVHELSGQEMGDIECQLERIDRTLKETYGKARLVVTGNMQDYVRATKSRNAKYLNIWRNVAGFCLENELNPRAYVEWVVHTEYPAYPMPYKFILNYKQNLYISSGKPDPEFNQKKLKFELMMRRLSKVEGDVIAFLLDPINAFDAIFQYTVAENLGRQDELPPGILPAARQQAFYQPVYADRFKNIVPNEVIDPWI
jgi:hypothetical protein